MLKNHLSYRRIVDSTCAQQFRKECAFFPALMVIICKCAQEPQKRPDVFRSDGLTLFCALGHRLKHFEGAQNNLVILNQKVGAFHEDLQLLQSPVQFTAWAATNFLRLSQLGQPTPGGGSASS